MPKSACTSATVAVLLCACSVLAGCGGAARQGGRPLQSRAFERKQSRGAAQKAHEARSPARFFAPTSFWNRALEPNADLDPNSAGMVTALEADVSREEAAGNGPWIDTTSDGVPILTVPASQPTVSVALDHAPDTALISAWRAVPLPPDSHPSEGSDGLMVVYQPSTDRMWEFWRLSRQSDGWHASWGGAMEHVSSNPGVYESGAWPGAKPWWGASASSLALAGGVITIEDLDRGRINHALAIALPEIRAGVLASPAQRTDGTSANPMALPEGAHLRLDPKLDLASLNMPPLTRMMAEAAQRYGILVRDFAGNVTFVGQDPLTANNPYQGPTGFFEGAYPSQLLASFPWAHLQVLRMDLHADP